MDQFEPEIKNIDYVQFSVMSPEEISALVAENEALKKKNEALEKEKKELKGEIEALTSQTITLRRENSTLKGEKNWSERKFEDMKMKYEIYRKIAWERSKKLLSAQMEVRFLGRKLDSRAPKFYK